MSVQHPGRPEWSLGKQAAVFVTALAGATVLGVVLANAAAGWTLGGTTPGGPGKALTKEGAKNGSFQTRFRALPGGWPDVSERRCA